MNIIRENPILVTLKEKVNQSMNLLPFYKLARKCNFYAKLLEEPSQQKVSDLYPLIKNSCFWF